jgi:hypothetical protein
MVNPEEINRLFDGEADPDGLPAAVDRIAAEGEMREQWTLTAMISDALAGVPWPDDGYSQRILARLDEVAPEPGYDPLAPED